MRIKLIDYILKRDKILYFDKKIDAWKFAKKTGGKINKVYVNNTDTTYYDIYSVRYNTNDAKKASNPECDYKIELVTTEE